MEFLAAKHINDSIVFTVNTHDLVTGEATDADSAPTYRVYMQDNDDPILAGTMSLLDGSNTTGLYVGSFDATTVNGFLNNKVYFIYISVVIDGVTATTTKCLHIGHRDFIEKNLFIQNITSTTASLTLGTISDTYASGGNYLQLTSNTGVLDVTFNFNPTTTSTKPTFFTIRVANLGPQQFKVAIGSDEAITVPGNVLSFTNYTTELDNTHNPSGILTVRIDNEDDDEGGDAGIRIDYCAISVLEPYNPMETTYTQISRLAPPASATLADKLNFIYKAWRNKVIQSNTSYKLYNADDITVDQQTTVADSGIIFTRNKMTAGS